MYALTYATINLESNFGKLFGLSCSKAMKHKLCCFSFVAEGIGMASVDVCYVCMTYV